MSTLSSVSIPQTVHEALSHPNWKQAMVEEMAALHSSGTWDLITLPAGKTPVGCRWVYTVKIGPDGRVNRLKAQLVAKGYTQVYGSDYYDIFSPVAKIDYVRLSVEHKKCLLTWRLGRGGLYEATNWVCCLGGV